MSDDLPSEPFTSGKVHQLVLNINQTKAVQCLGSSSLAVLFDISMKIRNMLRINYAYFQGIVHVSRD